MVFAIDIKCIDFEFIRINLQARRCPNACVSPGGLAVAGGPQSVVNRARGHRTKFMFAIGLRGRWMRLARTFFTRYETFLDDVVACK